MLPAVLDPPLRLTASTSPPPATEQPSFAARVEPEIPYMHRVARSVLRSDDLAWDAVQETLLRVWTHDRLPDEPRAVLRRLTVLSSLHILRCSRRRQRHEALAAGGRAEQCCEDDPFVLIGRADDRAAIEAALSELTQSHRQVVELFELQGAGYADIAALLELPIGTVRSRLHRARAELRKLLER